MKNSLVVVRRSGAWAKVFAVNTMGPMRGSEAFVDHVARSDRKLIVTLTGGMGSITDNNSPLGAIHGIPVDGYVGFRALSVDYSQGSGTSKFEFDNVIYGPVIGATMRF
jgi:NAD(P)-dependent dehydrogenase (short-subunit alcohol dehydrogenase family)